MNRAAHELPVSDLIFLAYQSDIPLLRELFNHDEHLLQHRTQIKGLLIHDDLAGLQLAHIEDFIDQLQQQMRRVPYLGAALRLPVQIIGIVVRDLQHTAYPVDRGAYIVAHPLQEHRLCHIGGIRPLCRRKELLSVLCLLTRLVLLMLDLASSQQQPYHGSQTSVYKHDRQELLRQRLKYILSGDTPADIVISLLGHDTVAVVSRYICYMPAVTVLLQRLDSHIVSGALTQQPGIIAGYHIPVLCHSEGTVGGRAVSLHQILNGKRVHICRFGRDVVICDDHPRRVFSGGRGEIDIGVVVQIYPLRIVPVRIAVSREHSLPAEAPQHPLLYPLVISIAAYLTSVRVQQDDAGQPESARILLKQPAIRLIAVLFEPAQILLHLIAALDAAQQRLCLRALVIVGICGALNPYIIYRLEQSLLCLIPVRLEKYDRSDAHHDRTQRRCRDPEMLSVRTFTSMQVCLPPDNPPDPPDICL